MSMDPFKKDEDNLSPAFQQKGKKGVMQKGPAKSNKGPVSNQKTTQSGNPLKPFENTNSSAFQQKPAQGVVAQEAAKRQASKDRAKQFKSQKDVQKAQDFDYTTDGGKKGSLKEAKYLIQNKGMSRDEVFGDLKARAESGDIELTNRMQNKLAKYDQRQANRAERQEARSAAKEKAKAVKENPVERKPQPVQPQEPYAGSMLPSETNTTGDFSVGRDLNQSVGKSGNMKTVVRDSNFGAGASVGNDYSVTIGNNQAGNSSGEGGGGGSSNPLSNMQSVAAYNALNNNQLARSRSEMSGYGRAAGAIEEAEKATGAGSRVATLYNAVGANQDYLRKKQQAVKDEYLGDLRGFSTDFVLPEAPPEVDLDPSKDIYEDAMDELD